MSSTNEELAISIQNGDKMLYSELWENNRKLLYQMSNRFYNANTERCIACGVELEDIQQICYFALCAAVEAYKSDSGYKFTTYLNYSFKNAVAALLNGGQRRRTADPLNISTSLDVPLSEDSETTKADLLTDDESERSFEELEERIFIQELNETLKQAMSDVCTDYEQDILNRLYWNSETTADIANSYNVTASYIRESHKKALQHLRSSHARRMLEPYREFIKSHAYHGVGLSSFRSSGISSVERVVEQWEQITGA